MTAALLERPVSPGEQQTLDGGVTLEERLTAALREAHAHGSTECPVCHARMTYTRVREACPGEPREGAGCAADALRAECGRCGSRLG
jgi:hypothetical protein